MSDAGTSPTAPRPATAHTVAAQEAFRLGAPMDWDDDADWVDARRGLVASAGALTVDGRHGGAAWDLTEYSFLDSDDCPDTVNPSLWRQARLNMEAGLFTIAEGIHQIRGFDLSEITIVEGETGYIVIDPLITAETAAAAMAFAREHLGDRPVTAVIYTHSHVDHFGGVKGVTTQEAVDAGECRVIAPLGMVEAAVSENVFAGIAMSRRAQYMYGALLPKGPRGQVDAGLGKTNSLGTVTLVLPTDVISESPQVLVVDGVEIEFQLTPGTEAPAEMNFWFPAQRALCMAENCSHNLHNLYTPRGAQVRDALAWAKYLDESLVRFEGRVDMVFTSHHWPVWGAEESMAYIATQRDLYRYLHDQTLRLANHGHTMAECAEMLELPDSISRHWCNRPYYGTVNHNVKAVWQRYLGWFSGNPAELHALPPEPAAAKYVQYMGGADAVVEMAQQDFEAGEYRWVAEVLSRVVFADPDGVDPATARAAALLADTLEQLGYVAESAVWRNFYLVGAQELRHGTPSEGATQTAALDVAMAMDVDLLLDAFALRLDPAACDGERLVINLEVTDVGERHAVWVENCVLHHRPDAAFDGADASLRLAKAELLMAVAGLGVSESVEVDGDPDALGRLAGWFDRFDGNFAIVTP